MCKRPSMRRSRLGGSDADKRFRSGQRTTQVHTPRPNARLQRSSNYSPRGLAGLGGTEPTENQMTESTDHVSTAQEQIFSEGRYQNQMPTLSRIRLGGITMQNSDFPEAAFSCVCVEGRCQISDFRASQ